MTSETIIDLTLQNGHPARPLVDVHVPAASAARFRLKGVASPVTGEGESETSVVLLIVNPANVPLAVEAERDGEDYVAEFPATHFAGSGITENGVKVNLVRDGSTFRAATGNLYVDAQDEGVSPADPTEHMLTKEELASLFERIDVADAATQKDIRVAVQTILEKLKGLAGAGCVMLAALGILQTAAAVDDQTAWEDMPPTSVVSQVVRTFSPPSPPTSLAPATNYTDALQTKLENGQLRVADAYNAQTADSAVSAASASYATEAYTATNAGHAQQADELYDPDRGEYHNGSFFAAAADLAAASLAGTNYTDAAIGSFAATGTVMYSEKASTAIGADAADDAYNLRYAEDQRSASQIFSILDESASTNYADTAAANAVANADTTYRRTIGITNLNQSVQYVNITDPAPTTLAISIPTDGATKDWIVYVSAVTNVTLSLPAVTWWMADAAYTNDVPPATPTAFYFSQVTDGIYIIGRQELTEVTAP